MRLRFLQSTSVAAGLAMILSGCSSPSTDSSPSAPPPRESSTSGKENAAVNPKTGKPIVLGFSQIGAESDWRKANTTSIQTEAKDRGIDLKFRSEERRVGKECRSRW